MNRMFRFNMRKSHHRIDSMMGSTFATTRNERISEDVSHKPQSPGSSGKKKKNCSNKQRSLSSVKASKNISIPSATPIRLFQSEKSFDAINLGDTSETELTVPHVDSSFSQNSDTENVAAPSTQVYISSYTSNDMTECYSLSDSQDETDNDDILFLGDVFEYVEDDEIAVNDEIVEDPIVLLALQVSKNILDDAIETHNADSTTAVVSDFGIPTRPPGKIKVEERHFSLDQVGNDFVEKGDSEQAVIQYVQALRYKYEALLGMYPKTTGNTLYRSRSEAQRRLEQEQHILASIATSINNLAFLQHNQGRSDANQTLALYQTALQIKRHVLGSHHLSVGKTLNNIGSIHYIQRDFCMAAQTYEEARSILQLHLGSHHLDVCTVTSNIGDVHCSMKQWTLAAKEYRTALELRWPLYGPSDPKNIRLMEQIAEIEMLINQLNAQKEDIDCSSSHDKCYGPVIKDVRKLHKELQRDIDHIDRQLASQLPLEMMKEKCTVHREIRDIVMSGQINVDRPYDHEDNCNSKKTNTSTSADNEKKYNCARTAKTKSTAKSIDVVVATEKEQIETPTATKKVTTRLQHAAVSTPKKLASPQLTSEERQNALLSVKEKLAKLRANRESFSPLQIKVKTDLQ